MFQDLARFLLFFASFVSTALLARPCIHYFQLESYQFQGYARTLWRQRVRIFLPCVCLTAAFGLASFLDIESGAHAMTLSIASMLLSCAASVCAYLLSFRKQKAVKPLVTTARVKRLYAVLLLLLAGYAYFLRENAILFALTPLLAPLFVALAAFCALPLEKSIFALYFRDAEKRLNAHDGLIRIGITGSYGKTSVKFILATLLSERYNVLATPASFNTPMGVTRVVRERLEPAHQVFIAEMGARHTGEIRELCRLVHPSVGVLTAVGPQHLDTFRTLERITKTKYELVESLPENGFSAFADDGDICTALYEKTTKRKALTGKPGYAAWAEEVRVSPDGSAFTLFLEGHSPIACKTRLLGEHNIRNICLAAAVASELSLTPRQISRGIEKLAPVEHRLQLLPRGAVTVIDDAFNANPRGTRAALGVLRAFAPARRVIVTPGMVELGAEEAEFNRAFGKEMAKCVDIALLVGGRHTAPIAQGLREAGFPEDAVHVFRDLASAQSYYSGIARAGDVVLYENDLPDNYSEA